MRGVLAVLAGSITALALWAPAAQAAPTRAEFVAQADAICKAELEAFGRTAKKKLLPALKRAPKHLTSKKIFRLVGSAQVGFGKVIDRSATTIELSAPAPPEDAAAVASWLASSHVDGANFIAFGRATKAQKLNHATKLGGGLLSHLQLTEQIVYDWGFQFCVGSSSSGSPLAPVRAYAQPPIS